MSPASYRAAPPRVVTPTLRPGFRRVQSRCLLGKRCHLPGGVLGGALVPGAAVLAASYALAAASSAASAAPWSVKLPDCWAALSLAMAAWMSATALSRA